MSLEDFRGEAYAFAEFQKRAAEDIEAGRLLPARPLYRRADPRKVHIGQFAAKILRLQRKERA